MRTFLYWLGGMAVMFGILGLVGLIALGVDMLYERHVSKRRQEEDEEGTRR